MILWHFIHILSVFGHSLQQVENEDRENLNDWRVIENIAEQHSFIVALLRKDLDFICAGTIINERVVLTSGSCVKKRPYGVLIGAAIIDTHNNVTINSIKRIFRAIVHPDYALELVNNTSDNKTHLTTLNSNIGLVFAKEPVLELFYDRATTSFFFTSDLINQQFCVIGFGEIEGQQKKTMQRHWYQQTPCLNPKWNYCICAFNYSEEYEADFGEGAPLMYGSQVIAIAALPSGILSMSNSSFVVGETEKSRNKYIIFTVLGPYLAWIEKQSTRRRVLVSKTLQKNGVNHRNQLSIKCICIFFVYIKLFI